MKIISALMICLILLSVLLVSGCTTPPVPDVELSNAKISPSSGQAGEAIFTITADYTDRVVPYNPIPNFGNETCDYNDSATVNATIVVPANPLWTYTGLTVGDGDTVDITASGSWNPGGTDCGPDGYLITFPDWYDNFYDAPALESHEHAALIAFIGGDPYNPDAGHSWGPTWVPLGDNAGYWPIGSGNQFPSDRCGKLWLGINDDAKTKATGDNTGNVTANITVTVPTLNDEHPRLAVDAQGNVHKVWMGQVSCNNVTHWEIFYAELIGDGPAQRVYEQISDADSYNSTYPSIALDSNDDAHVAWIDFRPQIVGTGPIFGLVFNVAEIYYQKIELSSGTRLWAQDRMISNGGGPSSDGCDSGRAVGFNVPPLGVTVDSPTNTLYIEHPGIAVDPTGWVHIVWSDNRKANGNTDGHWEVYYNMIKLSGSDPGMGGLLFVDDLLLTDPTSNLNASGWADGYDSMCPTIACTINCLYIAWQDMRDGCWEIYYQQRVPWNLNPSVNIPPWERIVSSYDAIYDTDIPTAIVAGSDSYNSASPDVLVDGDFVEITWMDQRPTWWQGAGYPGATACPTVPAGGQYCWEVYMAVLVASGEYLSTHVYIGGLAIKRESDMTVHVDGGNGLGDYTGPSSSYNQPDDNSMYPRMAAEPFSYTSSLTHITWQDYRDGNWEIYYKTVQSYCKNPGPDKRVTFDPNNRDMYPDIALQLTGDYRACIKWQSDRSGSWRIYDNHRTLKEDKYAAYMFVEIQPEGQPYPGDVMTFDMHPLIPSRNVAVDVPVTYGCTFVLSTPGHYQFRIQARDSAGYNCTTDWVAGPTVS